MTNTTRMNYSKNQEELIKFTIERVNRLFQDKKVPLGHGLGHITRVANWCRELAEKENAKNPFLCEMAGWLHDIGRALESEDDDLPDKTDHYKLSYELLRKWFRENREYESISDEDKLEILYAVYNHDNDQANDYDTAWILRDADKLDALDGENSLNRLKKVSNGDSKKFKLALRLSYQMYAEIRTKSAKDVLEKSQGFEIIKKYRDAKRKKAVKEVEL